MMLHSGYAMDDLCFACVGDAAWKARGGEMARRIVQPQSEYEKIGDSSWRAILRPFSLGLIGLALAVFLWGLAYKLSLYHPHRSHAAGTNVAKLSVGPRKSFVAAKSRMKVPGRPMVHLQPSVLVIEALTLPPADTNVLLLAPVSGVRNIFLALLSMPRSPPSAFHR
jgi:hypothetical protein